MKLFYCKKCDHEFEEEECYLNYKCPKCQEFCLPKGTNPPVVIWNTTLYTAPRAKYKS